MTTLLEKRHPDMDKTTIANTKKYVRLDINGNVVECLERKSFDEDFQDTTEIEKERVAIINYEKELNKLERKAKELKEIDEYDCTNSFTQRDNQNT